MIKAVAFDVGGVLDKTDIFRDHYLPLCRSLNIDAIKFLNLRKKYIEQASVGKISTKRLIALFADDLGVNHKKLMENWIKYRRKALKKDKLVEKIIKNLKKHGYKVVSLTNVIKLHYDVASKKNFYDVFHFNLASCNVGLRKPNARIYKLLIKKLKLNPEEIVFTDDVRQCLVPARKLGMKTILFKNAGQLKKDLKKLGVR